MSSHIAIVVSSDHTAQQALRKLWRMDAEGALAVLSAVTLHRDDMGLIHVVDTGAALAHGADHSAQAKAGILIPAAAQNNAASAAFFPLTAGQFAVVAEISEHRATALHDAMKPLGGLIYRRRTIARINGV
jgi:hypothetical protein